MTNVERTRAILFAPLAATLAASYCLSGCGGADAFQPMFPDNRDLGDVVAQLRATEAADRPVIVGLTEEPHRLYAYDLEAGRQLWEESVSDPQTGPSIAGEIVVIHEGDRVVARRLSDGRRAFDVGDDRLSLVGAAGSGSLSAIVLSTTGGVGAQSRVLLCGVGGVHRSIDVDAPVGSPAVHNGRVYVPWGNQNISVLAGETGTELARIRSLAGVVSRVRIADGALYFGTEGVGRLREGMTTGTAEEVGWYEPESEFPGAAPLWRNAYDPPANARSATNRIQVVWHPIAAGDGFTFADDLLYVTFYRFVFGVDPDDLTVRWAHQHDADVVGAQARAGGVFIADASGGAAFLGTDGRVNWSAEIGGEPTVVATRLGRFMPAGSPQGEARPVGEQLLAAALSTDSRLVPARVFVVRSLAAIEDAAVTGHLIVVCDDRSVPEDVRAAACNALSTRTNGAEAVMAALGRHASFLEGISAPPVGALATVAARLEERAAVPLLVTHLRAPDTPVADFVPLAAALAALGDNSVVEPLRDFLWLYHADAMDDAFAGALGAVARALIALAGPAGREDVQEVLRAPFTSATARAAIQAVLTAASEEASSESEDEP